MDIATQIYGFVQKRFSPSSKGIQLTGDTLLLEGRVVDSVGMLELVLFIEETVGLQIPEEDIVPENFDTINKLIDYVNRKCA